MRELHEVFIGVGTNVGNRFDNLQFAVEALRELSCGSIECSPVFETKPVGYEAQSDFLNIVVRAEVSCSPMTLLAELMRIEHECGRVRTVRYGPRTLDLDLLLYDDSYYCFRNLQVPHPRMWERSFVLVPLATLVPNRRVPGGYTVQELSFKLHQEGDVQYVGRFW